MIVNVPPTILFFIRRKIEYKHLDYWLGITVKLYIYDGVLFTDEESFRKSYGSLAFDVNNIVYCTILFEK